MASHTEETFELNDTLGENNDVDVISYEESTKEQIQKVVESTLSNFTYFRPPTSNVSPKNASCFSDGSHDETAVIDFENSLVDNLTNLNHSTSTSMESNSIATLDEYNNYKGSLNHHKNSIFENATPSTCVTSPSKASQSTDILSRVVDNTIMKISSEKVALQIPMETEVSTPQKKSDSNVIKMKIKVLSSKKNNVTNLINKTTLSVPHYTLSEAIIDNKKSTSDAQPMNYKLIYPKIDNESSGSLNTNENERIKIGTMSGLFQMPQIASTMLKPRLQESSVPKKSGIIKIFTRAIDDSDISDKLCQHSEKIDSSSNTNLLRVTSTPNVNSSQSVSISNSPFTLPVKNKVVVSSSLTNACGLPKIQVHKSPPVISLKSFSNVSNVIPKDSACEQIYNPHLVSPVYSQLSNLDFMSRNAGNNMESSDISLPKTPPNDLKSLTGSDVQNEAFKQSAGIASKIIPKVNIAEEYQNLRDKHELLIEQYETLLKSLNLKTDSASVLKNIGINTNNSPECEIKPNSLLNDASTKENQSPDKNVAQKLAIKLDSTSAEFKVKKIFNGCSLIYTQSSDCVPEIKCGKVMSHKLLESEQIGHFEHFENESKFSSPQYQSCNVTPSSVTGILFHDDNDITSHNSNQMNLENNEIVPIDPEESNKGTSCISDCSHDNTFFPNGQVISLPKQIDKENGLAELSLKSKPEVKEIFTNNGNNENYENSEEPSLPKYIFDLPSVKSSVTVSETNHTAESYDDVVQQVMRNINFEIKKANQAISQRMPAKKYVEDCKTSVLGKNTSHGL